MRGWWSRLRSREQCLNSDQWKSICPTFLELHHQHFRNVYFNTLNKFLPSAFGSTPLVPMFSVPFLNLLTGVYVLKFCKLNFDHSCRDKHVPTRICVEPSNYWRWDFWWFAWTIHWCFINILHYRVFYFFCLTFCLHLTFIQNIWIASPVVWITKLTQSLWFSKRSQWYFNTTKIVFLGLLNRYFFQISN